MTRRPLGGAGRIARAFLTSKLTPLLVVSSLLLGVFAVLVTPREEEPQIKVPMIDVMVAFPGASAREVDRRVVTPVEKAISEIPNVEYVYSTAQPRAMIIVRFPGGDGPGPGGDAGARETGRARPVAPARGPAAGGRPPRNR
jgi:hypothetical protein